MSTGLTRAAVCICVLLLGVTSLSAAELGAYRDFRLGSSTAAVIAITHSTDTDLKTDHARPALLQQLAWRRYRTDVKDGLESVRGIDFQFIDDHLFRMTVAYDPDRTAGLTDTDMIASLEATYGPRAPLPPRAARRADTDSLDAATVIAVWRSGDEMLALQHVDYTNGYSLVVTSVPLERLARKAQADAVVMDMREAPARAAALAKQEAAAARAAQEKTRTTNKEAFKP